MKKISRIITAAAAMAMAAVLCLGLASCGANHEKVITDGLNKELSELKAMDTSTAQALTDDLSSDATASFKLLGISVEDFCKQLFDGFDYKINSVKVNDKTAVASVDITMKDVESAMKGFTTDFQAMIDDPKTIAKYAGKSQSEIEKSLYSEAGKIMMDSFKKTGTKTATIDISYELKDNVWSPTSDVSDLLTNAFMSDLSSFL